MKERFDHTLANLFRKFGLRHYVSASKAALNESATESEQIAGSRFSHLGEQTAHHFDSIESGKRAQLVVYQTLWLQELVRRLRSPRDITVTEFLGSVADAPTVEAVQEQTRKLMVLIHATLKSFALEFNELTDSVSGFEGMKVSTSEVRDSKEQTNGKQYGMVTKGASSKNTAKSVTFVRCRVSTPAWSLSLRGNRGRIEFFLVPACDLFLLSQSETPVRLKTVLRLNERLGPGIWTVDGLPADPDELFYLCRALFKTLLFASAQGMKEELDNASILLNLEGESLRSTVRELLLAEQNMAQKIVSQQEDIQTRIARDLHDAVIADMMALKRSLSGDTPVSNAKISDDIDSICQRIREICHDLTPRDLKDWGLQTVIEDLLERVAQRTGADCSFECDGDLPEFPYPVQLHLFRIIQECLNNIEKYADATRVMVKFEVSEHLVKLSMRDNGKGFLTADRDARRAKEGGTGMTGIRERAEMIRCFYPTRLKVESAPGQGSATILEMRLSEGAWLPT